MPAWQRYTRIFGSFLITAACYTAYAAGIAPLLEPPRKLLHVERVTGEDVRRSEEAAARRREFLGQWFGRDDWELNAPLTLETPQGTLLFDDYQPRDGGLVEIHPCTIVLTSGEPDDGVLDPERARRAVIIRAPQGALLRFDSPIDLKKATIGKLIGGELTGDVEIRSDQRWPGPEDDLRVTTRNVALNQTEITTPEAVEFRIGPHYGRGRGVQVVLNPPGVKTAGMVHGVREFNLLEQVFVHIEPGDEGGLFPEAAMKSDAPDAWSAASSQAASPPVEVRCSGRFTYDFVEQYAIFRKQVDVVRLHPDGAFDQMTGDQLKIVMEELPQQLPAVDGAGGAPAKSNKLQPRRIEFSGEPVVIRAPTEQLQTRAQYVEHDLKTRSVRLRDAVEVILNRRDGELRAPEIFYIPDDAGGFGTFQAAGRGRLSGTMPDDPQQAFAAEWTTRLHFRRHEDRQVLSLHGAARFDATGHGGLAGDEIHLWMVEVAKPAAPPQQAGGKPKFELSPDRLLVLGNVQINSAQLTGTVNRLEGWFEQDPARAVAHRVNYQAADGALVPAQPATGAAPPQFMPLPPPEVAVKPIAAERQFNMVGDVLRMRIAVVAEEMQLREAVVERNVRLTETSVREPQQKPLLLTGDLLHVVQPTPTEQHVTVTGSPAYVEAQELTVSGGKLVLDRPDANTSRVGVAGQGVLTMPVDRDLQGRPTGTREQLHLSWQGGMAHDGRTAVFERGVEARLSSQLLRTDKLQVAFVERQSGAPPTGDAAAQQIRQIDCFGGVKIESRTTQPDGNPMAFERVEARSLSVDQQSGDFAAEGPGEVTSVRLGTSSTLKLPGQTASQPATGGSAAETKINYLKVGFQRQLVGNHPRREMTFINQVKTLYGAVPDWATVIDPDRTDRWSPDTVRVDCEKMQVFARTDVAAATETFDLIAEGNVLVEGVTFTARAPRFSYAQSKDLLVIEGDGRTDAKLFHQQRVGAQTSETSAKRFMIWPSTNRVQIEDAKSLELTPR